MPGWRSRSTRGLLLDVLATGDSAETDAAMERFSQLLAAQLNGGAADQRNG